MHDNFMDFYRNYEYDIAVIVLSTRVTISDVVAPACVAWTKQFTISNGSIGKVYIYFNRIK